MEARNVCIFSAASSTRPAANTELLSKYPKLSIPDDISGKIHLFVRVVSVSNNEYLQQVISARYYPSVITWELMCFNQ